MFNIPFNVEIDMFGPSFKRAVEPVNPSRCNAPHVGEPARGGTPSPFDCTKDAFEEAIRAHEDACRLIKSYWEARNRYDHARAYVDTTTADKLDRFNAKLKEAYKRGRGE